jgi:hypothetical protein
MVSEKPDEQNPDNPDDHDGSYLLDAGFLFAGKPNHAICTYCQTEVVLGEQRVVGEKRAAEHRHGLLGDTPCTDKNPNPDAGKVVWLRSSDLREALAVSISVTGLPTRTRRRVVPAGQTLSTRRILLADSRALRALRLSETEGSARSQLRNYTAQVRGDEVAYVGHMCLVVVHGMGFSHSTFTRRDDDAGLRTSRPARGRGSGSRRRVAPRRSTSRRRRMTIR